MKDVSILEASPTIITSASEFFTANIYHCFQRERQPNCVFPTIEIISVDKNFPPAHLVIRMYPSVWEKHDIGLINTVVTDFLEVSGVNFVTIFLTHNPVLLCALPNSPIQDIENTQT